MSDEIKTDIEQPEAAGSDEAPVSLEALEAAPKESKLASLQGMLAGRGWLGALLVALLIIAFLFLPPVSLGTRLLGAGHYTTLDAQTPRITHPDGLAVIVGEQEGEKLRVKLGSVPRADFEEAGETLPDEAKAAQQALPDNLVPKSPFFTIDVRGKSLGPATLVLTIPNEAEPWETLDVYGWDGTKWSWLPGTLDRETETLVVAVEQLPKAVMVMQTKAVPQVIAAEGEDLPPAEFGTSISQVDLVGMKIGTLGNLNGDPSLLPPGSVSTNPVLAPTVRNWIPGHPPNFGLVEDMLGIAADRAAHITALVDLAKNGDYPGLVLDYRALLPEDREAYAAFVADLANALHAEGKWLAVTVEAPQIQADGTWNDGAYDLYAIGKAADQVQMVMPLDPQAYTPGGQVDQMLVWATSKVNRAKLFPIFSTLSTDGKTTYTLDDVFRPLAEIAAVTPMSESVAPGTKLAFQVALDAALDSDATTGAERITYGDVAYWLGTPEWLRYRLDLTARYHLGGVVLRDLFADGNFPGIAQALQNYLAATPATQATPPQVSWSVSGPDGKTEQIEQPISQEPFAWTAPEVTGTYHIAASILGLDKGSIDVQVAQPVPQSNAEEEEPAIGGASAADERTPEMKAAFVADVTVPDNTHYEKGEQFTKTWRLKNVGSEPWPENTVARYIGGERMASVDEVQVGAVQPGETVDVSVDMTAPSQDGVFKSQWALYVGDKMIPGSDLWVVIQAGTPQQAANPAPATGGGPFELGGHILQGFRYADKMHYAGMTWVKVQVRYPGDANGIIAAAHANGFKIQISALGEAGMVTRGDFKETVSNWVAGIAAAGADAIEVWNEPNLPREWQSGYISPQAYTDLLCSAYAAIKRANPNTWVISAAPAPTGYFGGCHPHGCDDVPWLQGMYNAGAANCFDFIGAHHNSGATPPAATSGHPADPGDHHHSWYFLPQTQIYYNIFNGSKQLFYTELGYVSPEGFGWIPDTFAWGANTTVAQQAQWLADVVNLSRQTGMVRVVIIWNVDAQCYGMCGGVQDPQAGYAIIRPDGSCPACDTLHTLMVGQ